YGTQPGLDIPIYTDTKGRIAGIGPSQPQTEIQPAPIVLREGTPTINGQPLTQRHMLDVARYEDANFDYVLLGDVIKITSKDGTLPDYTQKIARDKDGTVVGLERAVQQTGPSPLALLDIVIDGNAVSLTREEAVTRYRAALNLRTVPKDSDRSASQISSHERWLMQEAALVAERTVIARLATATADESVGLQLQLDLIRGLQEEFVNAEADKLVPFAVKKKLPTETPAQNAARIAAWKRQVTLEGVRATAQPSVDVRTLERTPGVTVQKTVDDNGATTGLTFAYQDGTTVELAQWLQQLSSMGGGDHVRVVAMKDAEGNDIISIQYGDISGHGLDAGIIGALYKQIENEATRRTFQSLTLEQKRTVRKYIGENLGLHGVNPTIDLTEAIDDNTARVLEIAITGSGVLAGTYDASVTSEVGYLQLRGALFPIITSALDRYKAASGILQTFPQYQDAVRARIPTVLPYSPDSGMTATQKKIYEALGEGLLSINPDALTNEEYTAIKDKAGENVKDRADAIEQVRKAQAVQADTIERHTTESAI
ncbi:MAG: hypothetical protein AABY13_00610, partial [Nanoarchaeota archaeon]